MADMNPSFNVNLKVGAPGQDYHVYQNGPGRIPGVQGGGYVPAHTAPPPFYSPPPASAPPSSSYPITSVPVQSSGIGNGATPAPPYQQIWNEHVHFKFSYKGHNFRTSLPRTSLCLKNLEQAIETAVASVIIFKRLRYTDEDNHRIELKSDTALVEAVEYFERGYKAKQSGRIEILIIIN